MSSFLLNQNQNVNVLSTTGRNPNTLYFRVPFGKFVHIFDNFDANTALILAQYIS
ncbi:hypothetical protein [Candidatus Endowatersipora endosymbiont of Watersipora subatra]|uniref:hypothetical protein n=1 Tax=Candidatus Endowatersipora endosymbiont of Watersipora subatra TaxID=3077946 RepID=UPI00312CBC64